MKKLFAFFLMTFLVACANEAPITPIQLDFSSFSKIYLDTNDLRIIDRSKMTPHKLPYIGHDFTPTLTQAAHQLAAHRLQAVGRLGHATFIIKDANIVEQPLQLSGDMASLFTRQQASKYIGRLEVSLETQSPADGSVGLAIATAVQAISLPENPNAIEKQEAYHKLLTSLLATLNKNLDAAIHEHLSKFLISGFHAKAKQEPIAEKLTTDSVLPDRIETE